MIIKLNKAWNNKKKGAVLEVTRSLGLDLMTIGTADRYDIATDGPRPHPDNETKKDTEEKAATPKKKTTKKQKK